MSHRRGELSGTDTHLRSAGIACRFLRVPKRLPIEATWSAGNPAVEYRRLAGKRRLHCKPTALKADGTCQRRLSLNVHMRPASHIAKNDKMKDLWLPLAIFAGWFVLNAWVLPKFGMQT